LGSGQENVEGFVFPSCPPVLNRDGSGGEGSGGSKSSGSGGKGDFSLGERGEGKIIHPPFLKAWVKRRKQRANVFFCSHW